MPISLDVFVLLPVLWLPFAVYSNNEVARMIDGVWQRRKNASSMARGTHGSLHTAARVGLSTTGHGYIAVANLAHAVFLLCGAANVYFLVLSWGVTGHFGYVVDAPPGLEDSVQQPLDKAGKYVTWSIITLNLLMLSRLLYEKHDCCCSKTSAANAQLQQPLMMADQPVAPRNLRPLENERILCMFGCGCLPAPGRRRNGDPFDTCCRACAVAGGSPVTHDPECVAREQARQQDLGRW